MDPLEFRTRLQGAEHNFIRARAALIVVEGKIKQKKKGGTLGSLQSAQAALRVATDILEELKARGIFQLAHDVIPLSDFRDLATSVHGTQTLTGDAEFQAAELQRQKIEENARVIHAQETAAERDDEPDNEEIHGGPQGEGNLDADAPPPKKKTKMDDASLGLESGGQVFHLKEDIMADGTVEINIDGRRFRMLQLDDEGLEGDLKRKRVYDLDETDEFNSPGHTSGDFSSLTSLGPSLSGDVADDSQSGVVPSGSEGGGAPGGSQSGYVPGGSQSGDVPDGSQKPNSDDARSDDSCSDNEPDLPNEDTVDVKEELFAQVTPEENKPDRERKRNPIARKRDGGDGKSTRAKWQALSSHAKLLEEEKALDMVEMLHREELATRHVVVPTQYRTKAFRIQEYGAAFANTSRAIAKACFLKNGGNYVCGYHSEHRSVQVTDHTPGHPFQLIGVPGVRNYGDKQNPTKPAPNCFHCGCNEAEVLFEFCLWKEWSIESPFDSSYTETFGSQRLDPRTRAFVVQGVQRLGGLTLRDMYRDDTGRLKTAVEQLTGFYNLHKESSDPTMVICFKGTLPDACQPRASTATIVPIPTKKAAPVKQSRQDEETGEERAIRKVESRKEKESREERAIRKEESRKEKEERASRKEESRKEKEERAIWKEESRKEKEARHQRREEKEARHQRREEKESHKESRKESRKEKAKADIKGKR